MIDTYAFMVKRGGKTRSGVVYHIWHGVISGSKEPGSKDWSAFQDNMIKVSLFGLSRLYFLFIPKLTELYRSKDNGIEKIEYDGNSVQ